MNAQKYSDVEAQIEGFKSPPLDCSITAAVARMISAFGGGGKEQLVRYVFSRARALAEVYGHIDQVYQFNSGEVYTISVDPEGVEVRWTEIFGWGREDYAAVLSTKHFISNDRDFRQELARIYRETQEYQKAEKASLEEKAAREKEARRKLYAELKAEFEAESNQTASTALKYP